MSCSVEAVELFEFSRGKNRDDEIFIPNFGSVKDVSLQVGSRFGLTST